MKFLFFNALLILTLILQPVYLYLAYNVGRGEKLKVKPSFLKNTPKALTEEEKRALKEWENILNYDGTKESQEEIDW